jgi:peroxiredoxin
MAQVVTAPPRIDDRAPDFTLKDSELKPVRLGDYRGKTVILAFFPAAFSGVCTRELCSFRDHVADLNRLNVQVLGISVDLPYSLRQFKQSQKLSFPLLSDFDRQVISAYGIVDRNFNGYTSGVAQRAVFIINGEGTISWAWISEHQGQQPDYAEVLDHIGVDETLPADHPANF